MITDDEVRAAAKEIAGKIIPLSEFESLIHQQLAYNGAKWMQEETKRHFMDFIQSTGLSQSDQNLVKGIFYGFIAGVEYETKP